jgi:hypothetical protein
MLEFESKAVKGIQSQESILVLFHSGLLMAFRAIAAGIGIDNFGLASARSEVHD